MAGRFKPITYAALAFFVVAAIAPLFVSSWATLFALILAKSIVVLGIILLLQAGQVSFGHAMFLGTAGYVTAYALMASNREQLEQIANTLVERKEMHGDEVVDMLNSVGLKRPEIDLMDDKTWPTV